MRLLPVTTLACTAILAGCGDSTTTSAIPSSGATESAATQTEAAPAATGCRKVGQPRPKDVRLAKPRSKLDPAKTYTATVKTNCGTFAFRLDVRKAPRTTASIAYMASKHFYDGTIFHRIVPGFVIQGGDPTGQGDGGPGYSTVDKPPRDTRYTTGVVAMAKTGTEPAGTSGSQFFVVTGDASSLTPDYAVVGKVTRGLDVVKRIGDLGDASEHPTTTIEILSLRVTAG
jgi:cyclophilin family peptidyl-prolyl cis-trans isomerase